MKRFRLENIVATISILLLLWVLISTAEVVLHNGPNSDYTYSAANFFIVFFE